MFKLGHGARRYLDTLGAAAGLRSSSLDPRVQRMLRSLAYYYVSEARKVRVTFRAFPSLALPHLAHRILPPSKGVRSQGPA